MAKFLFRIFAAVVISVSVGLLVANIMVMTYHMLPGDHGPTRSGFKRAVVTDHYVNFWLTNGLSNSPAR